MSPAPNGQRPPQDVNIRAVPAIAYLPGQSAPPIPLTPEEQLKLVQTDLANVRQQLTNTQIAASTATNIACCMVKLLIDHGVVPREAAIVDGEEIVIPRALSEKMMGASITLSEKTDGNISVRFAERAPDQPLIIGR